MRKNSILQRCKIVHPLLLFILFCTAVGCSRKQSPPPDGSALFARNCASCHRADNDMRAPVPEALHQMSKPAILIALKSGRMQWEAKFLSDTKKNAIADYLAAPSTPMLATTGFCARDLDPPPNPPVWSGWGGDLAIAVSNPPPPPVSLATRCRT